MKLKIRREFEYEVEDAVFMCRELNAEGAQELQEDILNMASSMQRGEAIQGLSMLSRLSYKAAVNSVYDWQGIEDDSGKPVKFTPALLPELEYKTLTAIGKEALRRSFPEFESMFTAIDELESSDEPEADVDSQKKETADD